MKTLTRINAHLEQIILEGNLFLNALQDSSGFTSRAKKLHEILQRGSYILCGLPPR